MEDRQADEQKSAVGWWQKAWTAWFGGKPRFDCLQIEVSSRCPGRCRYCPRTLPGTGTGVDMSMAVFSRLAPLLACAQRAHLQGWGEPFLNPHFFTMARMARDAGCRISTTTCGLSMSESQAEAIVDAGLDVVAFSLSGTDEASNERRRGVPFTRTCQAISTLAKIKHRRGTCEPELHLAYLLFPQEVEALAGLPKLMAELGIAAAVVSTLDYLPDPALGEETFASADRIQLERTAALLAETAAQVERRGGQLYYHFPQAHGEGRGCLENIARSLFVAADGAVSPCVFTNAPGAPDDPRRRVFGNISVAEPLAIWHDPQYRAFRRDLAVGRPQAPCSTCRKRFGAPY